MKKVFLTKKKQYKIVTSNIKPFKIDVYIKMKHILFYSIYTCFSYIKYKQETICNEYNLNTIVKNSVVKKNTICLNLTHTSFINMKIKNMLYNKFLYIEHFSKKKKFITDIIPSNTILCTTHKHFCTTFSYYYRYNIVLHNINFNKATFILNKLFNIYKVWGLLSLNTYKYNVIKGFFLNKNNINTTKTQIKDITTGLSVIEQIFEASTFSKSSVVLPSICILNKTFTTYEETSLSYIKLYILFNLQNKNTIYIHSLNKISSNMYESVSSILLPQYSIINKGVSINNLILKIYFTLLTFYKQDKAVFLAHLYTYNFIVESLTKQYYKNNILIPSIQFEIIAKKMTSFISIKYIGDSSFNEKDIFDFNIIKTLNTSYYVFGYSQILYIPIILGISKSILAGTGFLSSISFQEILKNIINISMYSTLDWITDLKATIITSDFIKVGSGWYRHFSFV